MERLRGAMLCLAVTLFGASVALVWGNYTGTIQCPPLFGMPACAVLTPIQLIIIASILGFLGRRGSKVFFVLCIFCVFVGWWLSLRHVLALDQCPTVFHLPLCYAALVGFLILLWLGIENYLTTTDEAAGPGQFVVTRGSFRRRQIFVVVLLFLAVVALGPAAYHDMTDTGQTLTTRYGIEVIRTPASRFDEVPDYPFEAHFARISGMQMHYVDEGPRQGEVILLLHGVPTWSYVYRHMIPTLASAGYRVIAPDYLGFGKSDKPMQALDHSFRRHVDWMTEFIHRLQLRDITVFQQGWGGHLGMRLVADQPELFARVMSSNGLWIFAGDAQVGWKFRLNQLWNLCRPRIKVGELIQAQTSRQLTPEELEAYDAPFPTNRYKAAVRFFPYLVPTTSFDKENMYQLMARERIKQFNKPFLTAFSDDDPATAGNVRIIHLNVPGTVGQKHTTLRGKHFIQEDQARELAAILIRFIEDNPVSWRR